MALHARRWVEPGCRNGLNPGRSGRHPTEGGSERAPFCCSNGYEIMKHMGECAPHDARVPRQRSGAACADVCDRLRPPTTRGAMRAGCQRSRPGGLRRTRGRAPCRERAAAGQFPRRVSPGWARGGVWGGSAEPRYADATPGPHVTPSGLCAAVICLESARSSGKTLLRSQIV